MLRGEVSSTVEKDISLISTLEPNIVLVLAHRYWWILKQLIDIPIVINGKVITGNNNDINDKINIVGKTWSMWSQFISWDKKGNVYLNKILSTLLPRFWIKVNYGMVLLIN